MNDVGFSISRPAQLRSLGRVIYAASIRMQKAAAEHVLAGHPDQILILEHGPVFTLGRNASRSDIHTNEAFLKAQGIDVFETDRGGQVTYHGPGQIVVYPICNLKSQRQNLGKFIAGLEEVMIRTASDFGVKAKRLSGHPGIWVDTPRGMEKLGALGVHLRKWIATHGLAFNVCPDMSHYQWITPCGITDKGVCSLRSLLGNQAPTMEEATGRIRQHLIEVLALEAQPVNPPSRSVSAITWRMKAGGPEILMMLRNPSHGLWWSSVTGMLDAGETNEAAAIREVQEETGLSGTLSPLGFSHTFWIDPEILGRMHDELRFNTETCFHMQVSADAQVHLDLSEHSEYKWCPLEEARSLMRWEGSKIALRLLGEQICYQRGVQV